MSKPVLALPCRSPRGIGPETNRGKSSGSGVRWGPLWSAQWQTGHPLHST